MALAGQLEVVHLKFLLVQVQGTGNTKDREGIGGWDVEHSWNSS
jgi:hypothetical protein